MADRLTSTLMLALSLAALAPLARAQAPMADPTRPPASVLEPVSDVGAASGPVLQSALIPKRGKPVAVISGQQVRLGERYGESRLIKLSEREAVLEGPDGIERLMLTPGIDKTAVGAATNKASKARVPSPASVEGKR